MTESAVVQPVPDFALILAAEEQTALRRLSPRRNPWAEVAKSDQHTAELEQRRATLAAELSELNQRRIDAPARHAQALANWQLEGAKDSRPGSEQPANDARIAELHEDISGVDGAIRTVLEAKTKYVERHRGRLAKEARRHVQEASERYGRLIDELLAAREELLQRREAELFANLYAAPEAGHAPATLIAGGQSLRQVLGYAGQFNPGQIQRLLEFDREWAEYAASPEQRRLLGDHQAAATTVWSGSPEDIQQQRVERERRLAAPRNQWSA